jgi:phage tail-like protein
VGLTAWTGELGLTEGRIVPEGAGPGYVFLLGSDAAGVVEPVRVGDFAKVEQTGDLTGLHLIRGSFRLRPPAPLPAGLVWRFSILVDGVEYAGQNIERARTRVDLAADISALSGSHAIAFRLLLTGGQSGTTLAVNSYEALTKKATLIGLTGATLAMRGRGILVSGAAQAANNGLFHVTDFVSATSVKILNGAATTIEANNGSIAWKVAHYDLELPAAYVDSVVLVGLPLVTPVLANRDPEPNDTGAPADGHIALEILDVGGSGIATGVTAIYVDGVLAFDGGVFQAGFDGPGSESHTIGAGNLHVTIDPTFLLESEQVVSVRVVSQTTAGSPLTIDETYTFTVADTAGPVLSSAVASNLKIVRATFDEDVLSESEAGTADALNPASWELALHPEATRLPAVTPAIASITKVSESEFDVTADIELTPRAVYTLTAWVKDPGGNSAIPPTNAASFLGYQPAIPAGREFDVKDLVPQMNIDEDETGDLDKLLGIIQEVEELELYEIDSMADILDSDVAPEAFVDAMLADLGNPFDFELSLNDKRRLVPLLVPVYRQKGTDPGIINTIRLFLSIEVTITTPVQSGTALGTGTLGGTFVLGSTRQADLYTFVVESPVPLDDTTRSRMNRIIDYMKDSRCHWRIEEP